MSSRPPPQFPRNLPRRIYNRSSSTQSTGSQRSVGTNNSTSTRRLSARLNVPTPREIELQAAEDDAVMMKVVAARMDHLGIAPTGTSSGTVTSNRDGMPPRRPSQTPRPPRRPSTPSQTPRRPSTTYTRRPSFRDDSATAVEVTAPPVRARLHETAAATSTAASTAASTATIPSTTTIHTMEEDDLMKIIAQRSQTQLIQTPRESQTERRASAPVQSRRSVPQVCLAESRAVEEKLIPEQATIPLPPTTATVQRATETSTTTTAATTVSPPSLPGAYACTIFTTGPPPPVTVQEYYDSDETDAISTTSQPQQLENAATSNYASSEESSVVSDWQPQISQQQETSQSNNNIGTGSSGMDSHSTCANNIIRITMDGTGTTVNTVEEEAQEQATNRDVDSGGDAPSLQEQNPFPLPLERQQHKRFFNFKFRCLIWALVFLTFVCVITVISIVIAKVENDDDEEDAITQTIARKDDPYPNKEEGLEMFLQSLPPSTRQQIQQASTATTEQQQPSPSPQPPAVAAFQWLAEDPNLTILPHWRHEQRFAMVTVFLALGGNQWQKDSQDSWMSYEEHECDWNTHHQQFDFNPCDFAEKQFQRLVLDDIPNLEGRLPPEIGLLTSLKEIRITHMTSGNLTLQEFLPVIELAQLSHLENIDYSDSNFQGTIPTELSLLTQLKEVHFNSANLTGTLPTELAFMVNLTVLSMYDNQLTGTLPPQWHSLSELSTLWLNQNQLEGPLPMEWSLLPNLLALDLHSNALTGTLPPQWIDLEEMIDLRLDQNQLSGEIPEWNFPEIKSFVIDGNDNLRGMIPPAICNRIKSDAVNVVADCENVQCCG